MHNYMIQTDDLVHTILLILPLCYEREPISITVFFACYKYIFVSIAAVRHLAAGVGHPARARP